MSIKIYRPIGEIRPVFVVGNKEMGFPYRYSKDSATNLFSVSSLDDLKVELKFSFDDVVKEDNEPYSSIEVLTRILRRGAGFKTAVGGSTAGNLSRIRDKETEITNDDFLNLGDTPLQVVPELSEGYYYYYNRITLEFFPWGVPFDLGSVNSLVLKDADGNVVAEAEASFLTAMFTNIIHFTFKMSNTSGVRNTSRQLISQDTLYLTTDNGTNIEDGNGEAVIKVWYQETPIGQQTNDYDFLQYPDGSPFSLPNSQPLNI